MIDLIILSAIRVQAMSLSWGKGMTSDKRAYAVSLFENNQTQTPLQFSQKVVTQMNRNFGELSWGHLLFFNYVNYNYFMTYDNQTYFMDVMSLASNNVNYVYALYPDQRLLPVLFSSYVNVSLTAQEISLIKTAINRTNDVGYCYNSNGTSIYLNQNMGLGKWTVICLDSRETPSRKVSGLVVSVGGKLFYNQISSKMDYIAYPV